MVTTVYTYLFVINTIAFFLYAYDKRCACLGERRVRNFTLLTSAWIGGAYGALMGMLMFRHKTQSKPYLINVPLALVVWLAALVTVCII